MKSVFRALAGLVLATSASFASAQAVTLDFEEFRPPIGGTPADGLLTASKGFDFSNLSGGAGQWQWATATPVYGGSLTDGVNITGTEGTPGTFSAWVIDHDKPFTFQSMWGCCGPIYLELRSTTGASTFLGGFDYNSSTGTASITGPGILTDLNGNPTRGVYNNALSSLQLDELVIWSYSDQFAIDDIRVTVVPEPSAYAMMIAGLGAMALVARRRKNKATQV
jgi:PEP-CTERM motif